MIRDTLFETAMLIRLAEQRDKDRLEKLRTEPASQFRLDPLELRFLLGASPRVFKRLPIGGLPRDEQTQKIVVTGENFTALEATLCQILAKKGQARPS